MSQSYVTQRYAPTSSKFEYNVLCSIHPLPSMYPYIHTYIYIHGFYLHNVKRHRSVNIGTFTTQQLKQPKFFSCLSHGQEPSLAS